MEREDSLVRLIADLERSDKRAIRAAVDALTRMAGESPAVAGKLHELLGDPERKNGWAVAYVLAQLPCPPPAAIAALLEGLDHQEADIRWAIALLLVRLAIRDQPITQALLNLCTEGTPTQRRLAVYCVRDLNAQDAPSREALIHALHDEDPLVRMAAAGSLKRTAALDSGDRDRLLKIFSSDPDARVRSIAAITLAQRGFTSEEFFRALERASTGGDEQIGRAARAALDLVKNKRAAPAGS
jgi:HEAT repeat protein